MRNEHGHARALENGAPGDGELRPVLVLLVLQFPGCVQQRKLQGGTEADLQAMVIRTVNRWHATVLHTGLLLAAEHARVPLLLMGEHRRLIGWMRIIRDAKCSQWGYTCYTWIT